MAPLTVTRTEARRPPAPRAAAGPPRCAVCRDPIRPGQGHIAVLERNFHYRVCYDSWEASPARTL